MRSATGDGVVQSPSRQRDVVHASANEAVQFASAVHVLRFVPKRGGAGRNRGRWRRGRSHQLSPARQNVEPAFQRMGGSTVGFAGSAYVPDGAGDTTHAAVVFAMTQLDVWHTDAGGAQAKPLQGSTG